jgi:hypothetical protein
MLNEDQYMERTPDLVAKIRKMREAAEKEMNHFTRVADYDVRRVVGQKTETSPVSSETVQPSPTNGRRKRTARTASSTQASIEFSPAPGERGDAEEDA